VFPVRQSRSYFRLSKEPLQIHTSINTTLTLNVYVFQTIFRLRPITTKRLHLYHISLSRLRKSEEILPQHTSFLSLISLCLLLFASRMMKQRILPFFILFVREIKKGWHLHFLNYYLIYLISFHARNMNGWDEKSLVWCGLRSS
jgi:hypothetical protein